MIRWQPLSARKAFQIGRMRVVPGLGLAALSALVLAGCSTESPTRPEDDLEPGFTLIEGDPRWSTNSVSWKDSSAGTSRFAFISVSVESLDGPSHFLYDASFSLGCGSEECFPLATRLFVQERFDIFHLDWSPRGSQAVFEGSTEGIPGTWIYVYSPGSDPRQWVAGFEPTFSADGGLVFYVENGRDALRAFNPSSGGGFIERDGLESVAHPRVSLDGHYLAYSAQDGSRGRRIYVHDRLNPTGIADAVSDPDRLSATVPSRDGTEDDYPTWSPRGNFLAYRGRLREGTAQDGIFLVAWHLEPENPVELVRISPGRQMTYLRWHRSGVYLLAIIDGDVYVYLVPDTYRDNG